MQILEWMSTTCTGSPERENLAHTESCPMLSKGQDEEGIIPVYAIGQTPSITLWLCGNSMQNNVH